MSDRDKEDYFIPAGMFLSRNYALFAVNGVLAGLAVYLKDFKDTANSEMVNLGIVSSLLMFIVCSAVILEKLVQQTVNSDDRNLSRVAPYSALTIGVGGLAVSILSITIEFRTQLIQITDWGIGIAIYMVYLNWYPSNAYKEVSDISETTRERLDSVLGYSITLTVFFILFFFESFTGIYDSLFYIPNYEKIVVFPSFIAIIVLQFTLSTILELYVLFRFEGVDWITNLYG